MGLFDTLFGRTRQVPPNLDVLFAVPAAAYTLQAALGLRPTGAGAVCFKAAEGAGAQHQRDEMLALLDLDPSIATTTSRDEYGFTWIVCRHAESDLAALVTALHSVNATLTDGGFGPSLLCTVIGFTTAGTPPNPFGLVYLFKRGTWYPFAPNGTARRDTTLELQARAALSAELPIEPDLERWFPLWHAPVP